MLKIAVCVKQVPTGKVGMNNNTGNIERSQSGTMMNMYDYGAVETALRIKELIGAEIDVFTMEPLKAEKALREVKSLGVDRLFLISDRAFARSDVLATSYTISRAVLQQNQDDIILCGRQTTDGDTAQVPESIAVWLDYTYLPWVCEITEIDESRIEVCSLFDEKKLVFRAVYPCGVSVEPGIYAVRVVSLKGRLLARKAEIGILKKDTLKLDENCIGSKGSATMVKKWKCVK